MIVRKSFDFDLVDLIFDKLDDVGDYRRKYLVQV